MKHVSSISLGSSQQDFEFSTTLLGREMRVRRRGCDGSLAQALKWVKAADAGKPGERADALGLRLVKDSHHLGPRQALSQDATRLCSAALRGPVTTGARLGEIFQDWALRHAQATLGHYFDNANVLFFSGLAHYRLAMAMAEYSDNLLFADTLLQLGVPKLLTSLDALGLYASGAHPVSDWAPPRLIPGALMRQWIHFVLRRALQKATVVVADDDYLDIIQQQGPLSQEYLKVIKPVEMLSRVSPPLLMDSLEKVMAYAPPFVYSKVEGITSPNGVQAEGWLISVGGTPREIMAHAPEFTYRRLLDASRMAQRLGAQIMGLGAFTKVVGDAGVTVARRAAIPITTGNSYSASGALWAAHDAMLRLRLLVRAAEEVTLVSPETAKLLALKESILRETPGVRVLLSARADAHIAEMDMIVTATSGAGKKVLDILRVKPGCVITDVARPLDLPPAEVAKRPDVLVVDSGEIRLPGAVTMKNIGLPPGVVYACLAEPIVLALEGHFETYTIGRQIEWEKVREIYQLGLKHGMQLAAISGVNGVFSDADIERVRTLALAARAQARRASPPRPPAAPSELRVRPPARDDAARAPRAPQAPDRPNPGRRARGSARRTDQT